MTSQVTQKADSDSGKEMKEEKEEGEGNMAEKSRWWDHYYVGCRWLRLCSAAHVDSK